MIPRRPQLQKISHSIILDTTYFFTIHSGKIIGVHGLVTVMLKNPIIICTHRIVWKQHRLFAFFGNRYTSHQVYFAILQLFNKLRPFAIDKFIVPVGIISHSEEVLITIATSYPITIRFLESIAIVPAYLHYLCMHIPGGISCQWKTNSKKVKKANYSGKQPYEFFI